MENKLRPVEWIWVPCVGCGTNQWIIFEPAKIVISAPQVACSQECLDRWTVSMKSFVERQVTDG